MTEKGHSIKVYALISLELLNEKLPLGSLGGSLKRLARRLGAPGPAEEKQINCKKIKSNSII